MKKITLCADDYGQNESISQGILELVKHGRLSAVSCMTDYKDWPTQGAQLASLQKEVLDKIDIGLHFDLTHFIAHNNWSFNQFIIQTCLHTLQLKKMDLQKIETILRNQLDAFEKVFGCAPQFVDGHQHVHMFPGIRNTFIRVLTQRYSHSLPYVRLSSPKILGHDAPFKAIILRFLNMGFAQLAQKSALRFPQNFLGLYSLRASNYSQFFQGWLKSAPDGSLFMCHPGLASHDPQDPIKKARLAEFEYLRSDAFLADLKNNQATISAWHSI